MIIKNQVTTRRIRRKIAEKNKKLREVWYQRCEVQKDEEEYARLTHKEQQLKAEIQDLTQQRMRIQLGIF